MPFQLPAKDIFPNTAVRYPNLWILVSERLAANYWRALKFAVERLEESAEMFNDYGYFHTAEGCDAVGRRRGLSYVELGENGEFSHDHELHLRFYTHALRELSPVTIDGLPYYPIAISVHFEVDRPAYLHPYVDDCPVCGCTGEYAQYDDPAARNRASNLKNERIHDPLGLEAALYGTIRGKRIALIQGLDRFRAEYAMRIEEFESPRADINTAKLGLVYFT
ncbi:hypothetical protein U27_06482 [Candidatus Vecturithrix granuli]|uniref:Uncharacterized protein n=1 Tax=Vecturithrix granuli TaxID=1499967 RepID=A0A081C4J2_VECG1|nr:hypothetical protein U27_06482 [Candidatus Vecturithrix granuli]